MDGILLLATVALATLLAALKGIGKPHMHTNYNDTVRTDSVFYDLDFMRMRVCTSYVAHYSEKMLH